jgi:hypothetical protein
MANSPGLDQAPVDPNSTARIANSGRGAAVKKSYTLLIISLFALLAALEAK